MTRSAHGEHHDLMVALQPTRDQPPTFAYAIAKLTFGLEDGLVPTDAIPLYGALDDLRNGLPEGSDYWWMKSRTDVVVNGSAWAPGGKPTHKMEVTCSVGTHNKRIAVFGKRHVEWTGAGRPFVGPPEPFESVALSEDHAYGGMDPRVPIPSTSRLEDVLAVIAEPPGRYPRNPRGKGYLVMPDRVDGAELPNLEDPEDLLTDERLIVGEPAHWHRQPLPWCLGWQSPACLTRYARLGADAHFPVADPSTLAEVQRGFLPADYRERKKFDRIYHQEASLGMCFEPLGPGVPISLSGVHPERRTISFEMPASPIIEITIEESFERPPPLCTAVIIEPDAERVSFVYVAKTKSLPRTFIPGVHPKIPLSARVDGEPPVQYETPPVIRRPAATSREEPA